MAMKHDDNHGNKIMIIAQGVPKNYGNKNYPWIGMILILKYKCCLTLKFKDYKLL